MSRGRKLQSEICNRRRSPISSLRLCKHNIVAHNDSLLSFDSLGLILTLLGRAETDDKTIKTSHPPLRFETPPIPAPERPEEGVKTKGDEDNHPFEKGERIFSGLRLHPPAQNAPMTIQFLRMLLFPHLIEPSRPVLLSPATPYPPRFTYSRRLSNPPQLPNCPLLMNQAFAITVYSLGKWV